MGPLQYMVVAFEPQHFKGEVIPELKYLTGKGIIRIVDILFVARGQDGVATGHEFAEVLPGEDSDFCSTDVDDSSEWFTQDDIDVVGASLPRGSSVALLLFEHQWAIRLEEAVHQVNVTKLASSSESQTLAGEIEQLLILGSGAAS